MIFHRLDKVSMHIVLKQEPAAPTIIHAILDTEQQLFDIGKHNRLILSWRIFMFGAENHHRFIEHAFDDIGNHEKFLLVFAFLQEDFTVNKLKQKLGIFVLE